jgi:hypothetical protein
MVSLGLGTYVAIVTVLFFFWVYGIYAFVRDLRHRYLPALRTLRENRRREKQRQEAEQERAERERQLY